MKSKAFVGILAIIILVGVGTGGYLLGKRSNPVVVTDNTEKPQGEPESAKKKEVVLSEVINKLKDDIPTIKDAYEYSEDRDPNDSLGKSGGYYVAGANFYDARTGSQPTEKAFGTDAGGAIEVYENKDDAKKRAEYLEGFQGNPLLDPGAFKQVGVFVLRASSNYSKSQQDEVVAKLESLIAR